MPPKKKSPRAKSKGPGIGIIPKGHRLPLNPNWVDGRQGNILLKMPLLLKNELKRSAHVNGRTMHEEANWIIAQFMESHPEFDAMNWMLPEAVVAESESSELPPEPIDEQATASESIPAQKPAPVLPERIVGSCPHGIPPGGFCYVEGRRIR